MERWRVSDDLARLRVRGYVPSGPASKPRALWTPELDVPALLVHVRADERDRLSVATSRELIWGGTGLATVGEQLFTTEPLLPELLAHSADLRPDVSPGLDVYPVRARSVDELGKLISRRSYRSRWPVVGWDLPWTLGRLAGYTGRAHGRDGGFSIALFGTGIHVDRRWANSFDHARLKITAQGGGRSGALFQWGVPVDKAARYRGKARADFLDLRVLTSALSGSDLDDPAQACAWFDVPYPTREGPDPVAGVRAEAAALVGLYGAVMGALVAAAPGLAARDVWSFGSIGEHLLDQAGVSSPLRKAEHDPGD